MRRARTALALVATCGALLGLAACGTVDNAFVIEHGVCYRVRTEKTLGAQTHKEKVLAVPENCGLTTTTLGEQPVVKG